MGSEILGPQQCRVRSVMGPGTGVGICAFLLPRAPKPRALLLQLCLISQCYLGYPGMAQSQPVLGTLSLKKN